MDNINMMSLTAIRYVTAFGELAKSSTTMLLPGNPSDVGSAVAQAMAIYGKVTMIEIHLVLHLLTLTSLEIPMVTPMLC